MRVDGNAGKKPNYFPNSFDDIKVDQGYKEPPMPLNSHFADWYDRNCEGENDHFSQPAKLFQIMTQDEKNHTIHNIVYAMSGISGPKKEEITQRQLFLWYRVDARLGTKIAEGLGVELEVLPV
jgi:catalase